jgi:TonB family protein
MSAAWRIAAGLASATLAFVGCIARADSDVIVLPDVVKAPSFREMVRYYPKLAWQEGLEAHTRVLCDISAKGEVSNCQTLADSAPDQGFDAASVKFAPLIKMRPKTVNGVGVPAQIIVPLNWSMDYETHPMAFSAPSATALLKVYPAAARAAGRDGKATLECKLQSGLLADCRVVAESDPSDGFGIVALSLAPRFILRSCVRPKRGQILVEPVRVTFYWWAERKDGIGTGPERAALGYGNFFDSVITGKSVDRSEC